MLDFVFVSFAKFITWMYTGIYIKGAVDPSLATWTHWHKVYDAAYEVAPVSFVVMSIGILVIVALLIKMVYYTDNEN